MTDGTWRADWPAGEIRAGAGATVLTRRAVVALVNAAQRAGKFPPWRRDHWLLEVAAGGRRGAQAVTDLLALVPADPVTMASWPGDTAADDGAEALDDLYERFYPSGERAARELERLEARRAREASRFNRSQHRADNTMIYPAARPDPDPAASGIQAKRMERIAADPADPAGLPDDALFRILFGGE